MKRISFNKQFVNNAENDLIPGKIHTIRSNFDFWKRFEGRDVALFTWEGKPYQKGSTQKIFCVKKLLYVQSVFLYCQTMTQNGDKALPDYYVNKKLIPKEIIAENDGFSCDGELDDWAFNHGWLDSCRMAILHFTNFKY